MGKTRIISIIALLCLLLGAQLALAQLPNSPLLDQSHLTYLGLIRVPSLNGLMDYASGGLSYRPETNTMYLVGHNQGQPIGELTLPAPAQLPAGGGYSGVPIAGVVQPPQYILNAQANRWPTWRAWAIHPFTNSAGQSKVLYGVSTQWEAQVDHDGGFFVSNPDFTNLEGPFYTSWGTSRYTTGWVTDVPGAWQAALGGNALAGHCCAATISSTSFGPSAFAFTLQQVGQTIPLPITPLLYYTQQNPTIGDCAVPNPAEVYWHCHDNPRGMVIPGGYGTLLYFSQHGIGNTISPGVIYGEGSDWTTSAPREEAHDPAVAGRTYHAYPYRYQFLAYRLSDLAAVKAGQKQPWEVIPYARWYVPLPPVPDDGPYSAKSVGGMAYDPVRRRLYVVATSAEDGVRPLIHVFAVAPPPTTPLSSPENLRLTCAD